MRVTVSFPIANPGQCRNFKAGSKNAAFIFNKSRVETLPKYIISALNRTKQILVYIIVVVFF